MERNSGFSPAAGQERSAGRISFPADWRLPVLVSIVPLVVFGLVFGLTAWQSDDAYITYRTLDNFLSGEGLRWQPSERVQSYTHPLWLFLLLPFRFVSGEFYFSSFFLSFLLGAGGLLILVRMAWPRFLYAYLLIAAALLSQAYVDYSSSGLENGLSHFIGIFLVYFATRPPERAPPPWIICGLVSFGALNRLDVVVLYGPVAILALGAVRSWGSAFRCCAAFLPIVVWEVFSLVYYGVPFPNTAYAKALCPDVPFPARIDAALAYFRATLVNDPITLMAMWGVSVAAFFSRSKMCIALAVGTVLYQIYLFRIGGDFMRGRFFSLPLVVMLSAGASLPSGRLQTSMIFYLLILALLTAVAHNPFARLAPSFGLHQSAREFVDESGVADERAYYYPVTGLLSSGRTQHKFRSHPWYKAAEAIGGSRASVATLRNAGFAGFALKQDQYAIDLLGLNDPLLARLPAVDTGDWRAGHLYRRIPQGYVESRLYEENRLRDPELRELYDQLQIVTRGAVFSRERFRAIWNLNFTSLSPETWNQARRPKEKTVVRLFSRHYTEASLASEEGPIVTFGDTMVIHMREPLGDRRILVEVEPEVGFGVGFLDRHGSELQRIRILPRDNGSPGAQRAVIAPVGLPRLDPIHRVEIQTHAAQYMRRRIIPETETGEIFTSIRVNADFGAQDRLPGGG